MPGNVKVLYVDDESPNVILFKITFRSEFEIVTAQSAAEALEKLNKDEWITHVVCDLGMPDMNGVDFVKKAKSVHPSVRFSILTGYHMDESMQEMLDERLIEFVFRKPFDKSEIISKIKTG